MIVIILSAERGIIMGAGKHGGFGHTKGNIKNRLKLNLQFFASKVFEAGGHVSEKSFSEHREYFLGKSVAKIEAELKKQGYIVKREKSVHKTSKARKLVAQNPSSDRNIAVIQISPGSKRHGGVSYVKISAKDSGIFKVVSDEKKYRTDGKEKAKIYFARRKK